MLFLNIGLKIIMISINLQDKAFGVQALAGILKVVIPES
jgi:hypothetical protein